MSQRICTRSLDQCPDRSVPFIAERMLGQGMRSVCLSVCTSLRAPILDRLGPILGLFKPEPSLIASFTELAHMARDGGCFDGCSRHLVWIGPGHKPVVRRSVSTVSMADLTSLARDICRCERMWTGGII